jgi:hypothetical protein
MTDTPEGQWQPARYEDYSEEELYEHIRIITSIRTESTEESNRSSLYEQRFRERPHLPELALRWLTELASVGLHEPDPERQAHLKQADPDRPVVDPQERTLLPVRVGGHRQAFWLKMDGSRTSYGYKDIEVLDKPLRTHMAIIALLTALEANPIDVEKLREALSEVGSPLEQSVRERWDMAWQDPLDDENREWILNVQLDPLLYVLGLLQYYRPDYNDLPPEQRLDLISEASERVNSFLKAARQLVGFLEYGAPGHDLREAAENASRDVRAAVLKDVEGLNSIQIANRFGLPISDAYREKNEHKGVVEMINRGRKMLEGALDKDGWQKHIRAMKAEVERFNKLTFKEKAMQSLVDAGESIEEARQSVERIFRR